MRPALVAVSADPTLTLLGVFAALFAVGVLWPLPWVADGGRVASPSPLAVFGLGVAAFGVARVLGGGEPAVAAIASVIVLNTVAAVAEEAFFRRFVFGAFLAVGTVAAVVASTALFTLVHLTIYGWWALPIDLAAGLLFTWQRVATGSWTVPAATHAVANLMMVV